MRALTAREKWMLGLCIAVIFAVANGFAARSVMKVLRGSDAKIGGLKNTLADNEMWLDDAPKAEAREKWLAAHMPKLGGSYLGKLQGDLIQSLQDDLYNRKLRIERQSLQEIVTGNYYAEVAVRLDIAGAETAVIEWLTTLQATDKFQIIKDLKLELDTRSRELEPQAKCQITVARWYRPDTGAPVENTDPEPPAEGTTDAAPDRVESGS